MARLQERRRSVAVAVAAMALALPAATEAAEVVLRLRGGAGFEIAGDLRAFEAGNYVVDARAFGRLTLDASLYDCAGPGCAMAATPAAAPAAADKPRVASLQLEPAAASAGNDFTIESADAIALTLMPALVRGYAEASSAASKQLLGGDARQMRFKLTGGAAGSGASIDVERSDSTAAIDALARGTAAIALTARAITDAERAGLLRAAPQLRGTSYEHVIGLDGLVVIVAAESPATKLGVADLVRIFKGQATDWSQLGLPAGQINVYASTEKGGSADRLAQIVLGQPGLPLPSGTRLLPDEMQLSDAVARDPQGIAVTSLAYVRSARGLDITNACGLAWRPTPFAVKSEEYPLSRRLYLYSAGEARSAMAQGLVAFAASEAGQAVIRDSQLVDQSIELTAYASERERIEAPLASPTRDPAERRLAEAVPTRLRAAQRLSATFRFARNASTLDAKAREDMVRLAGLLKQPRMAGKRFLLVGFTDITGPLVHNVELSRRRAESVRDALAQSGLAAGVELDVAGYGPAAPVACNTNDKDRFLNRRVEVWMIDSEGAAR